MKFKIVVLSFLFLSKIALGTVETIPSGSFIINLGITPQTINNGLKPYGLVYEMLQTYKVPVKWVINPNKVRDGIDFTYDNISYKGSSFIILSTYRTEEVNKAIIKWQGLGVIGVNTSAKISLDVYATLTYAPKWTIDKTQGYLVTPFFENAGIPATAHGGVSQAGWKNPSQLSECDDIFALPHADPSFNTHKNLLDWNRDFGGAIWSGCHAVSVMEGIGLNFLTTNGMVPYTPYHDGTPPYIYSFPADPVMQFMGSQDGASLNGSESTYFTSLNSQWRPDVKLYISDPTNAIIPSKSAGPGVIVAMGRGFGDPNRGLVMYQGGHYHNGGTSPTGGFSGFPFFEDHVALQRAFFNFSFQAVIDRQKRSVNADIIAPNNMINGESYPIKFNLPANYDIKDFEITWQASSGTITPNNTSPEITFTTPQDPNIKIVLLTLILKDKCGRQFFKTLNINLDCPVLDFTPEIISNTLEIEPPAEYKFDVKVPSGINLDKFSIIWSVTHGLIKGDNTTTSIIYSSPKVLSPEEIIKVTFTDDCGNTYEDTLKLPINNIIINNGIVTGTKLVSANNDGNGRDLLYFYNLHLYAPNQVDIYNRWGNEIITIKNYDNDLRAFRGLGKSGKEVPDGVYYYVVRIDDPLYSSRPSFIKGYFILKR